ncbi:MAG: YihY/virulence factor BrkB family protein [Bacteroidetes bacterium]|nr:YihY/virulence factor BrkB family protein [Bacteroidota bacterium]
MERLEDFLTLRWVRNIWMYLVRIIERLESNHIFLSAAGLSFNALLCFIPLLLLVFYILGFYLSSEDALATVDVWIQKLELFPYQKDQLRGIVMELIQEFVGGSQLAGIFGAIGLLWTSSALFAALRTALNLVFNIQDTMNILVSKLKDFAMLSIVGMALIIVSVFLYGVSIAKALGENVFGMELESWVFNDAVSFISPFVLSFFLFIIVFYLVPDRRLPRRMIMIASSIAALLWGVAKIVFAYYLTNLWRIGSIYGPYAVIVATAIWVYYSSVTVLLAAEIAEMSSERRVMRRLFSGASLRSLLRQQSETTMQFPRIPIVPSMRRLHRSKGATGSPPGEIK